MAQEVWGCPELGAFLSEAELKWAWENGGALCGESEECSCKRAARERGWSSG